MVQYPDVPLSWARDSLGLATWLELELGSQLSSEHLDIVRDLKVDYLDTKTIFILILISYLVEDLLAVPVLGVDTVCIMSTSPASTIPIPLSSLDLAS